MKKKEFAQLDAPLNAQERFQHATIVRLEALIDMVGSIVDHLAEKDGVAVTEIKSEQALPIKEEVKPVEEKKPVAVPRQRKAKK